MAARTPPAHIYTSSLTRRERAWAHSRREPTRGSMPGGRPLRRRGLLRRALGAIAGGLLVLAAIGAAVLAAPAS